MASNRCRGGFFKSLAQTFNASRRATGQTTTMTHEAEQTQKVLTLTPHCLVDIQVEWASWNGDVNSELSGFHCDVKPHEVENFKGLVDIKAEFNLDDGRDDSSIASDSNDSLLLDPRNDSDGDDGDDMAIYWAHGIVGDDLRERIASKFIQLESEITAPAWVESEWEAGNEVLSHDACIEPHIRGLVTASTSPFVGYDGFLVERRLQQTQCQHQEAPGGNAGKLQSPW